MKVNGIQIVKDVTYNPKTKSEVETSRFSELKSMKTKLDELVYSHNSMVKEYNARVEEFEQKLAEKAIFNYRIAEMEIVSLESKIKKTEKEARRVAKVIAKLEKGYNLKAFAC